jgi:hypothetical protein
MAVRERLHMQEADLYRETGANMGQMRTSGITPHKSDTSIKEMSDI